MAKHGWVFISPLLIGFAVFYLEILVRSALFSFQDVTPGDTSFQTAWVGLRHYYTALFVDTTYLRNLVNATVQLLYNVPLVIIFSLFVATLLNQKLRGSAVFRAIFFIPAVLVTGAIAASTSGNALSAAMNELEGISTGAGASAPSPMEDLQNLFGGAVMSSSLYTYILSIINNIFGDHQPVRRTNPDFYSGPSVHFALGLRGGFHRGGQRLGLLLEDHLPLIGPMIYVNAIYTVVDSFTGSSNPIMKEVYSLGISQSKIGYASAYAWMYFAVIVLVLLAVTALMKLTMLRKTKG